MGWFTTEEKKLKGLELQAVHISGTLIQFFLDLSEFDTTLEIERANLDQLIQEARSVIEEAKIPDRDLIAEFGHNKIRLNDFSSFVIVRVFE